MATRAYGQYCGFSRALELVGERWALLLVRDLLVGPKRFSDLHRGLPGIPTNILTTRLKELEEGGLVRRTLLPRPGGVVYELTDYGRELEQPVITLGRWGAKRLGAPREGEVVTEDSIAAALMTTFRAEAAGRTRAAFEMRLGDITVNARVEDGKATVGRGPLPDADLVFEAGPELRQLMAQEITPEEALKKKIVRVVSGDPKFLKRFSELFRI